MAIGVPNERMAGMRQREPDSSKEVVEQQKRPPRRVAKVDTQQNHELRPASRRIVKSKSAEAWKLHLVPAPPGFAFGKHPQATRR